MKYKLLALDVDGTIVVEGTDAVPPPVHDAIQLAIAKGVTVSIVTARSHTDFAYIKDELKLPSTYHVIENGAKIIDPEGKILRNLHIPDSEVQDILNVAEPYFDEVGFCTDDQWINERINTTDKIVTGLSFTCKIPSNSSLLAKAIESLEKKYAVYPGSHWLNPEWAGVLVFHKEATKGKGMHFIQQQLGIKPEETIACGDGATDVTMFDYAGLKVAMGNADPVMKEKADIIASPVKEFGLVQIIEKFILNAS